MTTAGVPVPVVKVATVLLPATPAMLLAGVPLFLVYVTATAWPLVTAAMMVSVMVLSAIATPEGGAATPPTVTEKSPTAGVPPVTACEKVRTTVVGAALGTAPETYVGAAAVLQLSPL